jgi:hypothetical protein
MFKQEQEIRKLRASRKKNKDSIFESLILEALNEKELQKIMKKVMASGATGLISAIPSNKTNNSVAVRFDSEDTIDSGIKKLSLPYVLLAIN